MTRDVHVGLYGDVDLNIIDGSAVWLQSMATILARQPRNRVTVVLKAGERRDLLTRPLKSLERLRMVNPVDQGRFPGPTLSRNQALDVLEELDADDHVDVFVLRGFWLCRAAATRKRPCFSGRMWSYLTDIPQRSDELDGESLRHLQTIADASRYLLCQTEALRSFLESNVLGAGGKAVLLPPAIPDEPSGSPEPKPLAEGEPLRLVYVGKYAPAWNTYEMTQLVAEMRAEGLPVELHMVGDKVHRDSIDVGFHDRMTAALEETDGVCWHGGKSREETRAMLGEFHVALGWRSAVLDESLELSTKLLEYGAAGLPVIANRNSMHEDLFGSDYPLFANSTDDFREAVSAARDEGIRKEAATRCTAAAAGFRFAAVSDRLQSWIDRAVSPRSLAREGSRPLRVLVVSHDLKFFTRIQEHLAALHGVELRVDAWSAIDEHDVTASSELLAWADVVICEWCAHNAIWYSRRKRPNQTLIVRLHRFELYGRYPAGLNLDAVDKIVFVGDHYRDEAVRRLGWPPDKLVVIPNWVDTLLLDRPKVFGALFRLGMIGIAPKRKRTDRALGVLEKLREVDDRFQLFVKSKMPWEYPWIWDKVEEQEHFGEVFRRINGTPSLSGAVHFDPYGADVAVWLRKIGFVLSTSDDESFHLAPAEGMASRALPMLLPWSGASSLYPGEWIHGDEEDIAGAILSILDEGTWARKGEEVRTFVEERYSVERVCRAWEDLVVGLARSRVQGSSPESGG